jgi:hypothetical protein
MRFPSTIAVRSASEYVGHKIAAEYFTFSKSRTFLEIPNGFSAL